jgi:hypothetical protein
MKWTTLTFGKHKGKTLPQIIWSDPDWYFWFHDKGEAYGSLKKEAEAIYARARNIRIPRLKKEAEAIYARARNIRIPRKDGKEWVIDYHTDPRSGKFGAMTFINKETIPNSPFSGFADHIDFYVPKALAGGNMDKTGYTAFLRDVKAFLFGNASEYMTKEKCEEFFNDNDNFGEP